MKNKKVKFAIDKKIKYKIDEYSILAQFPNVKLHEIKKNRICLSISQLKNIFDIFNADFNKRFISLCQQQMEFKKYDSLDFYDVFNLINATLRSLNLEKKYDIQIMDPDEDLNIPKCPESPKFMSKVDYSMPLDEPNESFSFRLSNKIEEKVKRYEFENVKLKLKELENRILTLEKKQENQENESSKNF